MQTAGMATLTALAAQNAFAVETAPKKVRLGIVGGRFQLALPADLPVASGAIEPDLLGVGAPDECLQHEMEKAA